jgi:hypothetical protein
MQTVASIMPTMYQSNPINGGTTVDSQGGIRSMIGYRSGEEEKTY